MFEWADIIRDYYDQGIYDDAQVQTFVAAGWITQDEVDAWYQDGPMPQPAPEPKPEPEEPALEEDTPPQEAPQEEA